MLLEMRSVFSADSICSEFGRTLGTIAFTNAFVMLEDLPVIFEAFGMLNVDSRSASLMPPNTTLSGGLYRARIGVAKRSSV